LIPTTTAHITARHSFYVPLERQVVEPLDGEWRFRADPEERLSRFFSSLKIALHAARARRQVPARPWAWAGCARPGVGRGHWAPGCRDNAPD